MLKLDLSKIAPNSEEMTDELNDNNGAITASWRGETQNSDDNNI